LLDIVAGQVNSDLSILMRIAVVTLKVSMLITGISFSRIIGESRKRKSEQEILIGQKAELRCLSIECKDSHQRRSRGIQAAPAGVWSCDSKLSAHRTGSSHLCYRRKSMHKHSGALKNKKFFLKIHSWHADCVIRHTILFRCIPPTKVSDKSRICAFETLKPR
jgi:hypothetical protein